MDNLLIKSCLFLKERKERRCSSHGAADSRLPFIVYHKFAAAIKPLYYIY